AVAAVREMRHRQQQVVAIGEDLNDKRRGIEAAETELDATDRSIDDAASRVRELDARITAIEHEHPGGIPDSIRPEYARLLGEHNDAVTPAIAACGRSRPYAALSRLRKESTARSPTTVSRRSSSAAAMPGDARRPSISQPSALRRALKRRASSTTSRPRTAARPTPKTRCPRTAS